MLEPTLAKSRTKPLFLSIHFCLPHYPYSWARSSADVSVKMLSHYQSSIHRVDQQLQDFLVQLEQNGILKHSIVVLLSDHGEALELAGDRITGRKLFIPGRGNKLGIVPHFYPPSLKTEK